MSVSRPAIRPRRSVLYMPGSNARALEKAKTLPADALILDLEDAVAPDAKAMAREQVAEAVKAGGYGNREIIIRVNALDTPWGEDDLDAAVLAGPDAILVPKISKPEDVHHADAMMSGAAADMGLWIMMETPLAMLHAAEIAAVKREPDNRLAAMVMGTNDLAKETRARLSPGRPAMVPWLMACVAAARAEGIDIIDGVFNGLDDADGFEAECAQGRDFGMDGKTLIHPKQIEPANLAFSPDESEVDAARAIIEAFSLPENQDVGAISLNGRMVERLHAEMAERVVAMDEAIKSRQG